MMSLRALGAKHSSVVMEVDSSLTPFTSRKDI